MIIEDVIVSAVVSWIVGKCLDKILAFAREHGKKKKPKQARRKVKKGRK